MYFRTLTAACALAALALPTALHPTMGHADEVAPATSLEFDFVNTPLADALAAAKAKDQLVFIEFFLDG